MPRNQFEERQHEQSRLDIMTVIGHDLLEEIQQSVADVTGIAFVTVDYKGDVLTKTTHFCKYCKKYGIILHHCYCVNCQMHLGAIYCCY